MEHNSGSNKVKIFKFSPRDMGFTYALMVLGLLGLAFGWSTNPQRTWANFLLNSFYFITLSLSAVFFLSIQYVSGARWSEALRRIPEAISTYLPIGSILMLLIFFGMPSLYHWAHTDELLHDSILLGKKTYLNPTFFMFRMMAILFLWSYMARRIYQNSKKEDETGNFCYYQKNVFNSALFLVIFGITFSVASFDWLMSLEPHWFSTVFAIYCFSGVFVTGIAVISIMAVVLKEMKVLKEVNENHFHDLGKLLFAFSMFWAYIWYFQFMLIWYGNIPEETIYFAKRLHNDWDWLFYFNFLVNFVVPFLVILPRNAKRNGAMIFRVSIVLLVGHWLDLFLLVMPGTVGDKSYIGWPEITVAFGFAGLFIFWVGRSLGKMSILPLNSPYLEESIHHHQ